MRLAWIAAFLVTNLGWPAGIAAQADASTAGAAGAGGAAVAEVGGARVVEAMLPGRVLGSATTAGGGLAILLAPPSEAPTVDDGPRSVVVLDPADGSLRRVASGLPEATDAIAAFDGEVIVGEPGRIFSLGSLGETPQAQGSIRPQPILEATHLHPRPLARRGLLRSSEIYQPLVGRLRIFGHGEGAAGLELRRELELLAQVKRERTGLRLENPRVALLPRPEGAPLVLAGPVAQGARRLLTTVIDPDAPASEADDAGPGSPTSKRSRRASTFRSTLAPPWWSPPSTPRRSASSTARRCGSFRCGPNAPAPACLRP